MRIWNRWAAACFIATMFLLVRYAWANGIGVGLIAILGSILLVPVILFTVLTEGLVLAKGLHLRYRATLLPLVAANMLSLAAGIPVKIFSGFLYSSLPHDLAGFFRWFPAAAIVVTIFYFLITVGVEYFVIANWRRRAGAPVPFKRMATVVVLANLATYAVLAPAHYFLARPMHNIKEFTDDSSWAGKPLTEIFFIDKNSDQLCSIMTDGSNRRILIDGEVRNFQIAPETGFVLYKDANHLYLRSLRDGSRELCWTSDDGFDMSKATFSPDGKWVARLQHFQETNVGVLHLYDVATHHAIETQVLTHGDSDEVYIGWGALPDMLYLKDTDGLRSLSVSPDGTVTAAAVPGKEPPILAPIYCMWGSRYMDDVGDIKARALPGMGGGVDVQKGNAYVHVAVDPGLLHMSQRWFCDISILPTTNEVVFSDSQNIYLLDIANRKVGRITEGSDVFTINDRCSLAAKWAGH